MAEAPHARALIDRWNTPLYLYSTDSPLNTGASAKRDDGNTLVVTQGCQAADLVHILRPHHNIGRLAPRSRQASKVSNAFQPLALSFPLTWSFPRT